MRTLLSRGNYSSMALAATITLLFLTMVPPATADPIITCPPGTVDVSASDHAQVTIDLPIAGADSVSIANAEWQHDQLRFVATRPGLWQFTVIASSATDTTSCFIEVNVSFGDSPMANYSEETISAAYDRTELYLAWPRFVLATAWDRPLWFGGRPNS